MPESPHGGDEPPTPAVDGSALGGYPPLGDQIPPEPAPKKRSIWRWLAPSIAGFLLIAVGAVVLLGYLTTIAPR
jgi:hypothetical protein